MTRYDLVPDLGSVWVVFLIFLKIQMKRRNIFAECIIIYIQSRFPSRVNCPRYGKADYVKKYHFLCELLSYSTISCYFFLLNWECCKVIERQIFVIKWTPDSSLPRTESSLGWILSFRFGNKYWFIVGLNEYQMLLNFQSFDQIFFNEGKPGNSKRRNQILSTNE